MVSPFRKDYFRRFIGVFYLILLNKAFDFGFISFFFSFGAGGFGAGIGGLIAEHFGVAKIFPAMSIILIPAIGLTWLLKKRV